MRPCSILADPGLATASTPEVDMPDHELLLLSATEPDRLGLVAELTGFIAERGLYR